MSDYAKRELSADYGCSDGGCIYGHPGGMHTNGGCRCLPSVGRRFTVHDLRAIRRGILGLRARIARLESSPPSNE